MKTKSNPIPEYFIRPATMADVEDLSQITETAYQKWVAVLGRRPLPMQTNFKTAVCEHKIDLLCDGRSIIALIEMIEKSDHLLIENIAVRPNQQKRGHAKTLLFHAENTALIIQKPQLKLYTNMLMSGNVELYQSVGYEVEKREKNPFGTVVHMVKPLI